jgi:hypothetical protein
VRAVAVLVVTLAALLVAAPAAAQQTDSTAVGARIRAIRDTTPARVTPRGAFLRSLLMPGWGQSKLDRGTAGAVFVLTETLAAVMIVKSKRQLDRAKDARGDSLFIGYELAGDGSPVLDDQGNPVPVFEPDPLVGRIRSRRQQLEDWIAILAFNHLFSGADAFVAGHLGDIPRRLTMRPTSDGVELSASIAW